MALPALGIFLGGLLSEAFSVSQRTVGMALHAAAGIMLAVISVELMPRAIQVDRPWVVILAFTAGGILFMVMDHLIDHVQSRFGKSGSAAPWAIAFGVSMEIFNDGAMLGAGSTIAFGLALVVGLAQVVGNVPEGFATLATFKRQGISRRKPLMMRCSPGPSTRTVPSNS